MRARAARVRESRGSVLRLRGGDPDIACPDFSYDRRGLLFLSWNVWGLSSGEEGDTVHSNRLAELRCVLKEADSRGERVHALGIQETHYRLVPHCVRRSPYTPSTRPVIIFFLVVCGST